MRILPLSLLVVIVTLAGCGGADDDVSNGGTAPAKDLTGGAVDPGADPGPGAGGGGSNPGSTPGEATPGGGGPGAVTPPAAQYDAELQHCVDAINGYRKTKSLPALARSTALESFSGKAAASDASTKKPHGYFIQTKGGPGISTAQNEIPGWPMAQYKSLVSILDAGTKMMWNEGPGGGHYEAIAGKYSSVGCGIHVNADGSTWITQDFR